MLVLYQARTQDSGNILAQFSAQAILSQNRQIHKQVHRDLLQAKDHFDWG